MAPPEIPLELLDPFDEALLVDADWDDDDQVAVDSLAMGTMFDGVLALYEAWEIEKFNRP